LEKLYDIHYRIDDGKTIETVVESWGKIIGDKWMKTEILKIT